MKFFMKNFGMEIALIYIMKKFLGGQYNGKNIVEKEYFAKNR